MVWVANWRWRILVPILNGVNDAYMSMVISNSKHFDILLLSHVNCRNNFLNLAHTSTATSSCLHSTSRPVDTRGGHCVGTSTVRSPVWIADVYSVAERMSLFRIPKIHHYHFIELYHSFQCSLLLLKQTDQYFSSIYLFAWGFVF
jgi:hypothetical protein